MAAAAHPTAPPQTEIWLTVHDASAMLGVSPATLRRWSVNGEVEAFIARHERVYVIEMNRDGQLQTILRAELPEVATRLESLANQPGQHLPTNRRFDHIPVTGH